MPVVIGAGGVERIVEIELDREEKAAFDKSVAAVRELIEVVKNDAGSWADRRRLQWSPPVRRCIRASDASPLLTQWAPPSPP